MLGVVLRLTQKSSAVFHAKEGGRLISGKVLLKGPFSFSRAEREVLQQYPRAKQIRFSSIKSS
jgi:hypothetical protein